MDSSIIYLLVGMSCLAAMSYYLGFINPPHVLAYYSKAAFIVLAFMLIPFTVYVLWGQSTAAGRLAKEGIVPHPSITNSVGISSGAFTKGIWVFEAEAESAEVLGFYLDEENRPGWELDSQNPVFHMFNKDGRRLIIAATKKWSSDPTNIMYKIE